MLPATTGESKMAKIQTYPLEKVLAAREALRNLPTKEKEKSRAEVVAFLQADLRKAVKQGHSLKEIQALLAEQGIAVSLSRMEAVLGQSGKDSARKRTDSCQYPLKDRTAQAADVLRNEPVPARETEPEKMPSRCTPDLPGSE
jgi:hypothetical protein